MISSSMTCAKTAEDPKTLQPVTPFAKLQLAASKRAEAAKAKSDPKLQ